MAQSVDLELRSENARLQWNEGERRAASVDPPRRALTEHVIESILAELQRRIGQTYSTSELVELYERADEWCQQIAQREAPDHPWAWELGIVQDAAFFRYARGAQDYSP